MKEGRLPTPTLIAAARLVVRGPNGGHTVSGHAQKAALLAIWHVDGWPTSLERLSELTGASQATTWRAIEALIEQGVVHKVGREDRRWEWIIDVEKLESAAAKSVSRMASIIR